MRERFLCLFGVAGLFFISCNNNELPPVTPIDVYENPYSGTYNGLFREEYNGVDSTGVFKNLDSFEYDMEVVDAGNKEIVIQKGPFVFDHVPVDSNGYFSTDSPYVSEDSLEYSVTGLFRNDSLYVEYKTINGAYNYPDTIWFAIVHLSFRGKKVF